MEDRSLHLQASGRTDMASDVAIAIMRERAVARVAAALGGTLDTEGLDRDPGLAEAQLLERIADALEAGKEPEPEPKLVPEPEPEPEPVIEDDWEPKPVPESKPVVKEDWEPKPSFSAGKPKGKRS